MEKNTIDELTEANKSWRKTHIRKPFEVTRFDEERLKDKGRHLTIRLNEAEAQELEIQKDLLDTDLDSAVIKFLWKLGWNVTQGTLGKENLAWIASRDRTRSIKKTSKPRQNVTPSTQNQ